MGCIYAALLSGTILMAKVSKNNIHTHQMDCVVSNTPFWHHFDGVVNSNRHDFALPFQKK